MKKFLFGFFVVMLLAVGTVTASSTQKNVKIPEHALEFAPGLYNLGTAIDNGKVVEGFAIIKYKEKFKKVATTCGNGVCEKGENANKCPADCGSTEPTTSDCYGFLARAAKWKVVEPYLVNTINNAGLDSVFVASNLALNINKWESSASADILGQGIVTSDILQADTTGTDGLNEVYFGSIEEPGAIAITIVWGVFGGAPKDREIVEWDQVYDEVDYLWSSSGSAYAMDFESIATHELGHSIGLDDLYTGECAEQTMYGYASEGETKKRTLEAGDVTGVSELYK